MSDNEQNSIVIGVCGGIASGKSSVVKSLQKNLNFPIFSADYATYKAYQNPEIIAQIAELIPSSIENGQINKQIVNEAILKDESILNKMEAIIHPFVKNEAGNFIEKHKADHAPLIVIEVPLMFTSGMNKLCDYTIAITCTKNVCKERALKRKNMTPEKFEFIYKHQQKERIISKNRAHLVKDNTYNITGNQRYILNWIHKLLDKQSKSNSLYNKQEHCR